MSEEHKRNIQNSDYNQDILDLCQNFKDMNPSEEEKQASPFKFADYISKKYGVEENTDQIPMKFELSEVVGTPVK